MDIPERTLRVPPAAMTSCRSLRRFFGRTQASPSRGSVERLGSYMPRSLPEVFARLAEIDSYVEHIAIDDLVSTGARKNRWVTTAGVRTCRAARVASPRARISQRSPSPLARGAGAAAIGDCGAARSLGTSSVRGQGVWVLCGGGIWVQCAPSWLVSASAASGALGSIGATARAIPLASAPMADAT